MDGLHYHSDFNNILMKNIYSSSNSVFPGNTWKHCLHCRYLDFQLLAFANNLQH